MHIKPDKFHFECVDCKLEYSEKEVQYLCPSCSEGNTFKEAPKGVLKVIYNYGAISKRNSDFNITNFDYLKSVDFIDLLPINDLNSMPELRVGETPLYKQKKLSGSELGFNLFLKDDSQNPTFSFKDRASALVSAYAKENDFNTIIAASTGNAGSSLAGICASQGQKAIILLPESAPVAKLTQIIMYGASIIPVSGTYDDAYDLSIKATEHYAWYNRNTAFNPFTVEGKKTVSFELYEQLGRKVPDRIFVPVGDGVIISGVYKGFEDLIRLGIINKMPVITAVQASGSNNLIRNLQSELFEAKKSRTIADSISVDIPRNFYMTKKYIQSYNGDYVTVNDKEILNASIELSKNTGIFAEPAAAASYAAMLKFKKDQKIKDDSDIVVILTGSGLKDLESIRSHIKIPDAIEPKLENINKLLNSFQ